MANKTAAVAEKPPRGYFAEVKPNPLWQPQIQYLIRIYVAAKGEALAPCPVCGSKRRGRWTMLCPFRSFTLGRFAVQHAGDHPALELVCSAHPLQPAPAIMGAMGLFNEPDPANELPGNG